jgi:predicted phosphate transport protein (TIGR00153 family)
MGRGTNAELNLCQSTPKFLTLKRQVELLAMMFIPKEQKFFDDFQELADKIEKGSRLFLDILNDFEHSEAKVARLKEIEHEADNVTHIIYAKVHKTYITPLDREDIYALANKMDSILDLIEAAAIRMYLYRVKQPGKEIVELALILNKAIGVVKKVVHALRNKKNYAMIMDACVEINTIENEGDYHLRQSIARLFQEEKDPFELIKMKEIFERVEEAIDTCEDVSNIIEGIVLKNG